MRSYFFDASAVVRLYAYETGSTMVRDMVRSALLQPLNTQVLVCDLSLPETVSALMQIAAGDRAAERGLSRAALRQTLPRVRRDFEEQAALSLVPASGCMEVAADLIERHRMRVADAVQLAAALRISEVLPDHARLLFVSDDRAQCRAAEAEGLDVLRPAA